MQIIESMKIKLTGFQQKELDLIEDYRMCFYISRLLIKKHDIIIIG